MTGGVHVPWACAEPADPNISEAPKMSNPATSVTTFRIDIAADTTEAATRNGGAERDVVAATNR